MHFIGDYWSRFITWLAEGQNATVVLVFITGWYAYLTHRMTKAVSRQTTAMLQPALSLRIHYDKDDFAPNGYFRINNLGTQPVVLLDVRFECLPMGRAPVWKEYSIVDHNIVTPQDFIGLDFDFRPHLTNAHICTRGYSYYLSVVATDLGQRVVAEYTLLPVLGTQHCRLGNLYVSDGSTQYNR